MSHRLYSPRTLKGLWPCRSNVLDKSGYGRNATWSGTEAYTIGPFGHMVAYPNNAGNFTASDPLSENVTSHTFTAWFKLDTVQQQYLFQYGSTAQSLQYVFLDNANIKVFDGAAAQTIGTNAAGVVCHVAVVVSGSTYIGYVDGAFGASGTYTPPTPSGTTELYMGSRHSSALRTDGAIWGIRAYSCALTGDEIYQLYLSER